MAWGLARVGEPAAAENEASRLVTLRKALADQNNTYWSNQVEVQALAVTGWIALARGNRDEALKFMRGAADLEDSMEKHIVTPSPVVPARELLADMLLEVGQPAAGSESVRVIGPARAQPLPGHLRRRKGGRTFRRP